MILEAIQAPCAQIAENAGFDGDVVVANVMEKSKGQGFNALTGEYQDLLKAGVVDPVKVTRLTLEYASSVAGMMLTTNSSITDLGDKKPEVTGAVV